MLIWGHPWWFSGKESNSNAGDAEDSGSTHGLGRSPGEEMKTPLQYSCLENPMDRGAWWVTVHGVTKSQMRLSTQLIYKCCIHFSGTAHLSWSLLSCSVHPHTGLLGSVPLCLLASPQSLKMMQMGGGWVVRGRQCLYLSPDTAALLCLFPEQFHRWPWVTTGISVPWSPLLLGGTCPWNTQKELIRRTTVRE